MTKPKAKAAHQSNGGNAIILFGSDPDGKPRAARFAAGHAALAIKAAKLMNPDTCQVSSPALSYLAAKLPAGRIHANGRGFVPFVRRELFDKLVEAAKAKNGETTTAKTGSAGPAKAAGPVTGLPGTWEEIAVGHLVIAQATLPDGWWEAIVLERDGEMLKLRWRDFPKYEPFHRHIASVALMKPAAAKAA